MEYLQATVYPSTEQCVAAIDTHTRYKGAHHYDIREMIGIADGVSQYGTSSQHIQFVRRLDDGSFVPGVQSESVIIMLMNRHQKMDAEFPHPTTEKVLAGLQMALDAMKERVDERTARGVMGELKN